MSKKIDFSQNFVSRPAQCSTDSSSDDTSEDDVGANDLLPDPGNCAMLGGLRSGMRSIRNHARKELGNCESFDDLIDLRERLESSTVRLLQGEKMFLETARIVSGIVDDLVSDPEAMSSGDEDENGNALITVHRLNTRLNSDKVKPKLPGETELLNVQSKMAEMLTNRMDNYAETLTKDSLEGHPQLVALRREIEMGEEDFERKQLPETEGKDDTEYDSEDLYEDESILPTRDPRTKEPLIHPIKNKFCHHVYEEDSILEYMETNPGARCPTKVCLNKRVLETDHLVRDSVLTNRIRAKIVGHNSRYCY